MNPGILYISYDGMLEPLGQSQVLAYLERLAPGRRIHLISFEKPLDWKDRARREAVAERIAAAGIRWHPRRYHKNPTLAATGYDLALGSASAIALVRRHRLGVVHARSYVAGVMALAAKRATGAKLLFDMRGLWADERVDGGLWPAGGRLFRAAKRVERSLLLATDHVVTLTHASREELGRWPYLRERMPPVTVIPTCADLDRFTIQGPPQREPFVLGYVGSVGMWNALEPMLRFFMLLRSAMPGSQFLIVNRGQHEQVRECMARLHIPDESVRIVASSHDEVPRYVAQMSAGLAFYRPSYSRVACSPTKIAEYLGCGVPCVANSGVGDVERDVGEARAGVDVAGFADAELKQGVAAILELVNDRGVQQRCRGVAERVYSADSGAAAYGAIYDALIGAQPCAS